jgi:hypothetical protein
LVNPEPWNTRKRPSVTSCKTFFCMLDCWFVFRLFFCFFYHLSKAIAISNFEHLERPTVTFFLASIFLYAGGLICFSMWRWDLFSSFFYQSIKGHCHLEPRTPCKGHLWPLARLFFVCWRAVMFFDYFFAFSIIYQRPLPSRTSNTSKRPFVTSCKYFLYAGGLVCFSICRWDLFFCFFYQSIKGHCHLEPRTPGKGHLWPLASIFLYAGGLLCF